LYIMSYFTIKCNTHVYRKMDPDFSWGQLYNVQNEIKISKKHWFGLSNYYDN
jgi:hypothetical protein